MKYFAYIIVFIILHSSFSPLVKSNQSSEVKIIAHRGASFDAPENTMAAVKLGWAQNADAVEVDVHLSKDQRLMVIHDKDTRRTSGKDLLVKDTNSDELRKLEVGSFKDVKYSGEKIPYLEEVFASLPVGKQLFVEIKCGAEAVPVLKSLIEKYPVEGEIVVISFNYDVITAMDEHLPEVPAYWLIGRLDFKSWDDIVEKTKEAGAIGLNLHHSLIDKKSMKIFKKAGFPVYCWTVDDPDVAKKMVELGVKGITTNRPEWLGARIKT